jgi:ketosteroid isomerase-like protein
VVQLYEDGGTLRTVDGNFHGRDQIKEYLKTEIASGPQFAFSNAEPIEANKLGYDSGTFKETSTTGDGSLQERDGSYLLVARKDDKGAWEIAQHAFVDQKPGPSVAPCPACFVKNDFERAPVLKAEYYSDRTLLVSAGAFGPPF